MLISPAFAQAGGAPGGDMFVQLLPLLLIFVVFWFFLIRPQQKKAKQHREMVANVRRGDQVVTGGGLLGKVTKVLDENTVQVELAENVRVKVLSTTLQDVLSKGAPVAGAKDDTKAENKSDDRSAKDGNEAPTQKKSMFGFGKK